MAEEPNSLMNTIRYYKGLLRFPTKYAELDETQEQQELFFCNSKQRKEESLRLLREWAQSRMDVFEKNREIVEELANSCDYRIRLSVDFLQIAYKFFNEKYFHEQQYAQFLLTKPQPSLKQNPLSQSLYQCVSQAVTTFEENNLKRCEKIANFAHTIQTQILKAETFHQLSDMDKQMELLLSGIITQKKLLHNYITSAGQKLNAIIQQFPSQQQQRQRKPIFDEQPGEQQSRTDKILQNISTLGTLLVGAQPQQDPIEMELNQQLQEQEKHLKELQLKEEQSLSNGSELNVVSDIQEVVVQPIEQNEQQPEPVEQQKENIQVNKQEITTQPLESSAHHYKQQQQQKERQQQEQFKSKNYVSPNQPQIQTQQNKQQSDLYRLIISFVATQQYANKLLNQLTEKVVAYWKQVIAIEQKRAQWAKDSCIIYKNGINEVHNLAVELQDITIDVEDQYHFKKLLPKEIGSQDFSDQEEFVQSLTIKEIGCQAARLLLVKEFKVHIVDKTSELPAILVLTIDKYVGCWLKHDDTIEAVDNPVLHYPLTGMVTQKSGNSTLDLMPSRHLLFLNIANDKQKSRIKFQTSDDMEEFCTIAASQ